MRGDGISKKQLACSKSDARATMRPAAAVEAHRQRECDPPNRSRRPIQSQGNRFERQPPAPPQTYDASFVRAGGAPVAFAMSDEPERKPERKGTCLLRLWTTKEDYFIWTSKGPEKKTSVITLG